MHGAKVASQFNIPNAFQLDDAPGGVISTPAVDAELYLQGGHLTG